MGKALKSADFSDEFINWPDFLHADCDAIIIG